MFSSHGYVQHELLVLLLYTVSCSCVPLVSSSSSSSLLLFFAWLQSICAVFVTTRMGYIVLLASCKHLKACMCAYWFLQIRAQRIARGYAQRGPLAGGGDMPGWHQAAAWQILLLFRFAGHWGLVQAACIVRPLALEVEDVPLLLCRCASLSTEPSASMLLHSASYYQ